MPKAAVAEKKVGKEKGEKKIAKKEPVADGQHGIERDHDLPWSEKKVTLFETLKALKATSASKAASSKQIIEKSGETLSGRDVRHYSYHARAGGLIDLAKVEGVTGYSFYLTAKGVAINPNKAFAQQEKEKQAKQKDAKAAE